MASAEFTEESKQKRPNVQVGDPFMEKLLLEACIEAMQTGAIVGIQDMGAAGLTCSTCEMGSRGEVGIEIELDRVPQRETGMTPTRSCSRNRRSACCWWPTRAARTKSSASSASGAWTPSRSAWSPATASCACATTARSSPRFPTASWPTKRRSTTGRYTAPPRAPRAPAPKPACKPPARAAAAPDDLLQALDLGAVRLPGAHQHHRRSGATDAAIVRIKETGTSIAMSLDGNGRYTYLSPREGAQLAVAECCRNLSVRGRAARGGHQLPQLRQSRAARDHGATGGSHRRHGRRLPLLRHAHHRRQRQPVQRNPGRGHLPHARDGHRGAA
jgi:hypothetical protein